MSFPLFLYKFSKVYVLGAVGLMVIYGLSHHKFQSVKPVLQSDSASTIDQRQVAPSKTAIPPTEAKATRRTATPVMPKPQEAVKPKYVYLLELASGGSMKAKGYKVKGGAVRVFIDDGYEITMAKSDIISIKKIRL